MRSRMEYLIITDNIIVLLLRSNLVKKYGLVDVFPIRLNDTSEKAYFLGNHVLRIHDRRE